MCDTLVQIDHQPVVKEPVVKEWTCELCNLTMNRTTKSKHLKTKGHAQKAQQKIMIPKSPQKPLPPVPAKTLQRWEVHDLIVKTLHKILQPVECRDISESVYTYLVDWWFEQPQTPTIYHFCSCVVRMLQSKIPCEDPYDFLGEITVQKYLHNQL